MWLVPIFTGSLIVTLMIGKMSQDFYDYYKTIVIFETLYQWKPNLFYNELNKYKTNPKRLVCLINKINKNSDEMMIDSEDSHQIERKKSTRKR